MGRRVRFSARTLLVLVLLLVAAGVPCAAWFVAGSHEVERESRRVVDEARADARNAARLSAQQLGARLEKLRASESQRPYFHYQNLIHDPRGASQGLSVVPSPLANGPADPLILTHFQIDPKGKVTMPTLNDDVRELNAPDVGRQRSMRTELAAAAPQLLRAGGPALVALETQVRKKPAPAPDTVGLRTPPPAVAEARPTPPAVPDLKPETKTDRKLDPKHDQKHDQTYDPWTALQVAPRVTRTDQIGTDGSQQSRSQNQQSTLLPQSNQATQNGQALQNNVGTQNRLSTASNQAAQNRHATTPAAPPAVTDPTAEAQSKTAVVQKLDPNTFAQNSQSNAVFRELKSETKGRVKPKLPPRRAPDVDIATSDFAWSSVEVGGKPSLAALRPVVTPDGAVVQGFVVSSAALADVIRGAGSFLRIRPGIASKLSFPMGASGWSLDIDDRAASVQAVARAAEIRNSFRRTFYAGLGATFLALIAVAFLVWRTERLARERSQFAAAAAHELRTPLAGLRLYGDMLAHQLGNPERSRVYAGHVAQEADRLGRVVSNMLEYTRLERGSLTVKRQPGDLGAAVRECVDQLRPALEVAGCPITLAVGDDLPPVAFDRDAVHHIVQNLLDNAEKYSRLGGEPSGEEHAGDRTVHVEVSRLNGSAALTVSDRGTGIDPRTARHLFAPFERGSDADAPAGLGLGLVLVKALAEAHGGDVTWSARSGGGTTFRVRLPT